MPVFVLILAMVTQPAPQPAAQYTIIRAERIAKEGKDSGEGPRPPVRYTADFDGDGVNETLTVRVKGFPTEAGDYRERWTVTLSETGGESEQLFQIVTGEGWSRGLSSFLDLDADGRLDMLYHDGDDTQDELTFIINGPDKIATCLPGTFEQPGMVRVEKEAITIVDYEGRLIGTWDGKRKTFVGPMRWSTGDAVRVRNKPSLGGTPMWQISKNQVVVLEAEKRQTGEWALVRDIEGSNRGYVSRRFLTDACPPGRLIEMRGHR